MTTQQLQPSTRREGKARATAPVIDMTPMVDLGFLLISFFIFTTSLSAPKTLSLVMPAAGPPSPLAQSKAMTVLLSGNDKVYVYEGDWEKARRDQNIIETGYHLRSGMGALIRAKKKKLDQDGVPPEQGLVLIIKPAAASDYKNFIDAVDEVLINGVQRYAVVEPSAGEKSFLQQKQASED